jgi:hypothetical protein
MSQMVHTLRPRPFGCGPSVPAAQYARATNLSGLCINAYDIYTRADAMWFEAIPLGRRAKNGNLPPEGTNRKYPLRMSR